MAKNYHVEMAKFLKQYVPNPEHIELIILHSQVILRNWTMVDLLKALHNEGYSRTHNRRVITYLIEVLGLAGGIKKADNNEIPGH